MSSPKPITKTFQYGDHTVTIETGEIARQASGAVLINMADTVVLVTAVGIKEAIEGRDFFPLTVNYQERTYAAGRIPGGFFRREGRPSEKETLTARLLDRPRKRRVDEPATDPRRPQAREHRGPEQRRARRVNPRAPTRVVRRPSAPRRPIARAEPPIHRAAASAAP